ncbi:MAG TPA: YbaB/EbfC family nucleoid-associated protein [Sedimentibacter sp.]|jgi:DNA-binding YbaB/EbfC family protein|nr:YbaB/EbfC family nucleoid-associated protein [Tissierellia bacterium]HAS91433.1 YbaB/EbfC family nucleoid-associated protein [Clostridiales bacterium]HOT22573.1 YbaB/EbfC family nucleoid-associated protein [Sedimentibacter sp.]HPB79537.1 YbaB/EbfC family nucleoid-associated protein [Sedimentibacter sp.]HPV85144.1 YbaB/EbfC family nucleoid-associated protein [Sedimentibacter sp.]
MAKGRKMPMGMPGGGNMNNMMKQVQKMQRQMEEMQKELEQREVEATSGGGAVLVKVTGKKNLVELKIDPEVVDKDDVEMLEDMIVAAVNEAFRKADEMMETEMKKVTGGLNIPGLI